jgi:hypothetical protein
VPGHIDGRLLPLAVAERLVAVWRRGARDGVGAGRRCGTRLSSRGALEIHAEGKQIVLVPCDLGLADPERTHLDVVLRPFVLGSSFLAVRAAHREMAAGNADHFKADFRTWDVFCVRRGWLWLSGRECRRATERE